MGAKFDIKEAENKINEYLKNNKNIRFTVSDILLKIQELYPFKIDVDGQMDILILFETMVKNGRLISDKFFEQFKEKLPARVRLK